MAQLSLITPPSTGAYHVAGPTPAGPFDVPVLVTSMGEFRRTLGTRTPETAAVYDELELFFAEGGAEAYVTRVPVGSTPLNTVTALDLHAAEHPTGLRGACVSTPGLPAGVVGKELIAHAAASGRIALLAEHATAGPEQVKALAAELALEADGDHAGLFFPWVSLIDVTGTRKVVPPTAFAAAARARAHRQVGYWTHPAGERSRAKVATELVHPVTEDLAWELADHLVSAIATTRVGTCLWGWWSLAGDRPNFAHLTTRDLLNNIAASLSLHMAVISRTKWASADQTYAHIRSAATAVLTRLAAAGGLAKPPPIPGSLEDLDTDDGWRLSMVLSADRTAVEVRVDVRPVLYARLVGFTLYRIPLRVPIYPGLTVPQDLKGGRL